jgi:hypothetical protein
MAKVLSSRRNQEPPGFQFALRELRKFAHRRSLIVGSPTRLIGAERTFFGDSDDVSFGPKDYKLVSPDLLFEGGLFLSKKEASLFKDLADTLLEMSDVDILNCRAPTTARVPPQEDERGRWDLMLTSSHRVGTVTRSGEGSKKRYVLWLWDGAWYRMEGAPCYDLPVFGLPELRGEGNRPVMIHEGPKAWEGALRAADSRMTTGRLANWMSLYTHVAWHGADVGLEWTDWSPLRGRRVMIWPDMDEAGLLNARALARRIALMGGIVDYIQWSVGDIEKWPSWDWADATFDEGCPSNSFTRTELRERIQRVESPLDASGRINEEWAKRSFYDAERGEIYEASNKYRPLPINAYSARFGPQVRSLIANSGVNPFVGTDFRPGLEFGRMTDGKINIAGPNVREPIVAAPLERKVWQRIVRGWLARMIPDPRQRKHLIRRAAWALIRPEKVPRHMLILQGNSGVGKSVFMDTLVKVGGRDRAASLFPDSILNKFNAAIVGKSIVCIHEIHSNDITRRQNASRLKELVANETLITEEKNRPRQIHTNIIHWFAATNERVPFSLEHGNDRFYFIKCADPKTPREARQKDKFFARWVPRFEDPEFQDRLYAAAKWLVLGMGQAQILAMTSRAAPQSVWKYLENASLRPWEQKLLVLLSELMEQDPKETEDHPPVFFGQDVIRLVSRDYKAVGVLDIRSKMVEFGYRTLRDKAGSPVRRRIGNGRREPLWCRAKDLNALIERGAHGSLIVRSLGEDTATASEQ